VGSQIFLCFCEWEILYLIFNEDITVLDEYILNWHYNSKHKIKYEIFAGALKREKVESLKRGLQSEKNIFRKQSNYTSSALQASYRVAHLLAKQGKPLSCW
jgi:hypothetical protein